MTDSTAHSLPRRRSRAESGGERKLELLLRLGDMVSREVALDELLCTVGERVAEALHADRATLWLLDSASGQLRTRVANLPELDELCLPAGHGIVGHVVRTAETVNIASAPADPRWSPSIDRRTGYATESMLCVPIPASEGGHVVGALQLLNKRDGAFTDQDEAYLHALADQVGRALGYTTLYATPHQDGVRLSGTFNHIVGSSPAMQRIYEQILRTAGTDATVLLRGETGTGKGLIARALHVNSERRDGPLVELDCTNLPSNLVESELFGHERGAYTGAEERVLGKVELARGGTLFLDEIGELPLALQSKLLRFIQERRFERVGGRETLEVDVRLVAATNRDLGALVRDGQFRADLYYRLRVVDILLPPLRERGEADILALAEHFSAIYARRYQKRPAPLPQPVRRRLARHDWPGNVRELEHTIERAVVLGGDVAVESGPEASALMPATGPTVELSLDQPLRRACEQFARAVLEHHDGNRSQTARALEIGRNRLARLLAGAYGDSSG